MTTHVRPQIRARNVAFWTVRKSLNLTQEEFARKVREAGEANGERNSATKRLIQRWESGGTDVPRGNYARALRAVTGYSLQDLGFSVSPAYAQLENESADQERSITRGDDLRMPALPAGVSSAALLTHGLYAGIWLSRYQYFSSGRDDELTGLHYVVILHHGNRLTVQSLPNASLNPKSPLSMDLKVEQHVATGSWKEETDPDGYYRGAVYHGAIQMLVEPTGRRMEGKWVGFGKDFEVNSGPWELVFQTADTGKESMQAYNRPPVLEV